MPNITITIMQHKDTHSSRKKPPFAIEHFTIRIQEYEVIQEQNQAYIEEWQINVARQRQILREIGAATPIYLQSDKEKMKAMREVLLILKQENNPIYTFILEIQEALNNADKLYYEEQLKVHRLEEELRVIRFRNN